MITRNAWHYVPGGKQEMSMDDIEKGIAGQCPLGRVAIPQDISRVVGFLAHEESEWINGMFNQFCLPFQSKL